MGLWSSAPPSDQRHRDDPALGAGWLVFSRTMTRMGTAVVQHLRIHPLKSAQGIALERVRLGATGCEWDRRWMVIRPDGAFLTQRTTPALARIAVTLNREGLRLESGSRPALSLPLAAAGAAREVRIWKDVCAGADQGDEAAEWVSGVLGEPARIVRSPDAPLRRANPTYAGPQPAPIAFVDAFPLLMCNQASLDALNARLGAVLPMERFRPNLVLAGLEPFAEDRIETLHIGPVRLRLVKPCTRCVIPSHDQRTGLIDIDPMPVLRTFRYDAALRGVTFGVNAVIEAGCGESIERGAECRCEPRRS
jgi:uncharacterized protein YcbX